MLNNVKIGPKLIGGFLLVSVITLVIGLLGVNNMGKINNMLNTMYDMHLLGISHVKEANINVINIGRAVRQLVLAESMEERTSIFNNIDKFNSNLKAELDAASKTLISEEAKKGLAEITSSYEAFMQEVGSFRTLMNKQALLKLDEAVVTAIKNIRDKADKTDDAMTALSILKDKYGKEMYDESDKIYASMRTMLIVFVMIATMIGIFIGLFLSRSISVPLGKVVTLLQDMSKGEIDKKLSMDRGDELGILAKAMDTLTDSLKDLIVDDGGAVLEAAANKDMTKRLKKDYKGQFLKMKDNINRVIESLDLALTQVSEATEQVSSASQQISAGSQSLAQGANEQASSLEEVSSSLEEMASMTKQNADNANQAKGLASESDSNAKSGAEAMNRMSSAINRIKESSDQTAKIVKTIDEIAMQTNLLALNAAVEAARAGEAGRGFAVVAEEVRNLAQRSAEAAKNTADMITDSVKNADDGVKIATEVSQSFEVIATSAKKVNDLIGEIAAASQEQSQGIDQVNTAVAQMDKVTQQNAANSEESASAAEELSSQAEELQGMVSQFKITSSVQSRSTGQSFYLQHHPETIHTQKSHSKHTVHLSGDSGNGNGHKSSQTKALASTKRTTSKKKAELVEMDELIPMDDDALREF